MLRSTALPLAFIAVWSSGYVVGSIASHDAPAIAITFWRILLAGALLAALAVVRGARWPRGLRSLAAVATVGLLTFGVQFGGLYLALSEGLPAATASLLISCCPLLIALVQVGGGRESLTGRHWLGALLGLAGVALALEGRLGGTHGVAPLLWALVGMAGFAIGTVLMPRLVPDDVDPLAASSVECFGAVLALAPWGLATGGLAVPLSSGALGSGAWLTVVNGVGGPLILLALVRSRGATRASSLLYVVPAVTAFVAWPVLGEAITVWTLAGLVVAGAGVALVQTRSGGTRGSAPDGVALHTARVGSGAQPAVGVARDGTHPSQ